MPKSSKYSRNFYLEICNTKAFSIIWYYTELVCLELINSAIVLQEDISPIETIPCSRVCVCV